MLSYAKSFDWRRGLSERRRDVAARSSELSILVAILPDACFFTLGSFVLFFSYLFGNCLVIFACIHPEKDGGVSGGLSRIVLRFIVVPANNAVCPCRLDLDSESPLYSVGFCNIVLG